MSLMQELGAPALTRPHREADPGDARRGDGDSTARGRCSSGSRGGSCRPTAVPVDDVNGEISAAPPDDFSGIPETGRARDLGGPRGARPQHPVLGPHPPRVSRWRIRTSGRWPRGGCLPAPPIPAASNRYVFPRLSAPSTRGTRRTSANVGPPPRSVPSHPDIVHSSRQRPESSLDGEILAESLESIPPVRAAACRSGTTCRPRTWRTDLLKPSDTRTFCAYKGQASYWSAGRRSRRGVELPAARCARRPRSRTGSPSSTSRVELVVDGDRLERPVTPWSRK